MAWQDNIKQFNNLQHVQRFLGEVSMIWSAMDRQLDAILTDLLDIAPAKTAAIVTGMLPAKKCHIIARLVHLGCPSPQWQQQIDTIISEISGKFGDERNRLVHDAWRVTESEAFRIDARAKVQRKQSRADAELVHDTLHLVTFKEMAAWCKRGYEINQLLMKLQPDLVPWLLEQRAKLS